MIRRTCDMCGREVGAGDFHGARANWTGRDLCGACLEAVRAAGGTALGTVSAMALRDSRGYAFANWESYQLAGPMAGIDGWNAPAFAEAEAAISGAARIAEVRNPARGVPEDAAERPRGGFMAEGLHALTRAIPYVGEGARPAVGALVLLPGWERSEGAVAEAVCAHECGIDLVLWRGLGDAE